MRATLEARGAPRLRDARSGLRLAVDAGPPWRWRIGTSLDPH
jgi:hypothetical protein